MSCRPPSISIPARTSPLAAMPQRQTLCSNTRLCLANTQFFSIATTVCRRALNPLREAVITVGVRACSRSIPVHVWPRAGEVYLMDLGSTHGTFMNKKRLEPQAYVPLRIGSTVKLGLSSRQLCLMVRRGDAPWWWCWDGEGLSPCCL